MAKFNGNTTTAETRKSNTRINTEIVCDFCGVVLPNPQALRKHLVVCMSTTRTTNVPEIMPIAPAKPNVVISAEAIAAQVVTKTSDTDKAAARKVAKDQKRILDEERARELAAEKEAEDARKAEQDKKDAFKARMAAGKQAKKDKAAAALAEAAEIERIEREKVERAEREKADAEQKAFEEEQRKQHAAMMETFNPVLLLGNGLDVADLMAKLTAELEEKRKAHMALRSEMRKQAALAWLTYTQLDGRMNAARTTLAQLVAMKDEAEKYGVKMDAGIDQINAEIGRINNAFEDLHMTGAWKVYVSFTPEDAGDSKKYEELKARLSAELKRRVPAGQPAEIIEGDAAHSDAVHRVGSIVCVNGRTIEGNARAILGALVKNGRQSFDLAFTVEKIIKNNDLNNISAELIGDVVTFVANELGISAR